MDIMYWFLPLIISLGLITSYEDLKFGKIRNRWITLSVLASIIINIVMIFILKEGVNELYYADYFINGVISLLLAFVLYYYEVWSNGDGKLFFAYSLAIPLMFYSEAYYPYFPSFNLLVNIFIPYLVYNLTTSLFNHDKRIFMKSLKNDFKKDFILFALKMFSINWIVSYLLSLGEVSNTFLIFGLTMLIYQVIPEKIILEHKKTFLSFAGILIVLRFIFDKSLYTYIFWVYFIITIIAYKILFGSMLKTILGSTSVEYIDRKHLKEGMILGYNLAKNNKTVFIDKKEDAKARKVILRSGTIITEKEIYRLHDKKINFKIPIYKKIVFAHIMFIGVLLTLLTKGNILIYLVSFFR